MIVKKKNRRRVLFFLFSRDHFQGLNIGSITEGVKHNILGVETLQLEKKKKRKENVVKYSARNKKKKKKGGGLNE